MKIAIIHDRLVEFGGAERVLQSLFKLYPHADIYTSRLEYQLASKSLSQLNISKIKTSFIQYFPFKSKNSIIQILSPFLWKSFNLKAYDLIISNSAVSLCNLVNTDHGMHIAYINCIPKNLFGLSSKLKLQKYIPYTGLISNIYRKSIQSTKHIIVNSRYTQNTLKSLFGVNSTIIYPPVSIPKNIYPHSEKKYYLIISRIDREKKIELAILACNHLELPLIIAGKAADKTYEDCLKKISGSTIKFLGWQTDDQLEKLYKEAKGFIFTSQNEDFGIAPVEAMAHGVPVIAFYGGGVKETVVHKKTGLFYYQYNAQSLIDVLKKFDYKDFHPDSIYKYASKFSEMRFISEFNKYISELPD